MSDSEGKSAQYHTVPQSATALKYSSLTSLTHWIQSRFVPSHCCHFCCHHRMLSSWYLDAPIKACRGQGPFASHACVDTSTTQPRRMLAVAPRCLFSPKRGRHSSWLASWLGESAPASQVSCRPRRSIQQQEPVRSAVTAP